MEQQHDPEAHRPLKTAESSLAEIARATAPPPARLPVGRPAHIPATTTDSNATASLVLGIISLCLPVVSFPTALLGLVLGYISNEYANGTARIGITLNTIALAISLIAGIVILVVIMQG